MLDIDGLRKRYGRTEVLRGVDLGVKPGELVGLIGPNGSGKSTLMHCVTGVVEPSAGRITIDGMPYATLEAKARLGFVPDDLRLPEYLTGAEYIDLIRNLRPGFDLGAVRALLAFLGVEEALGRLVGHYSHGMKKKLQIAVIFAGTPRVLILDEPFSGLDPQTHTALDVMLKEFRDRGGSVLISTHDLRLAQRYFDRVYILSEGRVIESGPPREICEKQSMPSLSDVFVRLTAGTVDPRTEARRLMGEIYGS